LKAWSAEKVISLDFHDNYVAAGAKIGSIYVWDREGKQKIEMKISGTPLVGIKWMENNLLICGTDDGELIQVNVDKKSSSSIIKLESSITSLAVIPNKNMLIAGDTDGYLHFIDVSKMVETASRRVHKSWVRGISVVPGKQHLVYSVGDDGRLMKGMGDPLEFNADSRVLGWVLCLDSYRTVNSSQMIVATGSQAGSCEVTIGSSKYKIELNVMINNILLLRKETPKITLIVGTHGKGIIIIPGYKMKL
jgi:WD40 repeat protein